MGRIHSASVGLWLVGWLCLAGEIRSGPGTVKASTGMGPTLVGVSGGGVTPKEALSRCGRSTSILRAESAQGNGSDGRRGLSVNDGSL